MFIVYCKKTTIIHYYLNMYYFYCDKNTKLKTFNQFFILCHTKLRISSYEKISDMYTSC